MPDPFPALRLPDVPVAPEPTFAAALRSRLVEALLRPYRQESRMTTTTAGVPPSDNGLRPGDISYLTFGVPDIDRARAFYGALLGWSFDPPSSAPRSSVGGVRPQMGLGTAPGEPAVVLAYRVADIAAAVQRIQALGGTATDPVRRPYALEADCRDRFGIPFYLHEFADGPTQVPGDAPHHGDVAYISLGVADLGAAREFYGEVLGWSFSAGTVEHGLQVDGVTPMAGLWGGGDWTGARLAYRVDDIADAAARVVAAGGTAGPVEARPYGLACDDCVDDQGGAFMLLQLSG